MQVASATATFVMMFSSSLSVVEFYFLRRFPIPFGKSMAPQVCLKCSIHFSMYGCSTEELALFSISAAGYLIFVSVLAGFWGQCLVRKIVHVLKRASLIVFILSSVIFASALTMGKCHLSSSVNCLPYNRMNC